VAVTGLGNVSGDVAWSGNWFFLCHDHGQHVVAGNIPQLTVIAQRIRLSLVEQGITGADGAEIDHIELMQRQPRLGIDARSFVLCPGSAYDRSPCGTGTSAIMVCEYAAGHLKLKQTWHQESIIGSVFSGQLEQQQNDLIASISGTAYVNGECRLIVDPQDPFAWGIV
jgi:4-hydroxyproline epimerase